MDSSHLLEDRNKNKARLLIEELNASQTENKYLLKRFLKKLLCLVYITSVFLFINILILGWCMIVEQS